MKSTHEVYAEIIASHQELERIPTDVHLFCPRLSDDDQEDYDDVAGSDADKLKKIEDGQRRLQLTSWASLILGINRDQADRWLPDWIQRTESFLVKCDGCVRAWHMGRKALRSRLLKEFDEETTNIMEGRLHDYDTARIDRGLRQAVAILEQHGPMSSAKLVAIDATAVLAFYEALCCVEYLSLPENRRLFNIVFQKTQEKKPLKIASAVIPTMTVFLFQADPLRNRFARTAWERRPAQSLTPEQFEWAVSDHLADAIDAVSKPDAADAAVQLFWDGFLLLLDAMSEDVVLHCLRGMQIPMDVYQLAVLHLDRPADGVLAGSLRALCALMDKSAKAFWDALSRMNPPQLPMFLCRSPAFAPFLARSFEEAMQLVPDSTSTRARMPLLVAFVRSLMRSLNRNQRSDVCDYLLSVFLTNTADPAVTATREGHSTCIVAGLTALQMTLDGYLDARYRLTSESALFVTTVINSAVKHHDYVVRSANLHPSDRYNIGLSQAAVGVVESALALDTRAIQDEWRSLQQNARLPPGNERRSAQLWHGFRTALGPGRLDLARVMLTATLSLRGIQRFSPKKRQVQVEDGPRRRFNDELEPAAEAIAQTIERVGESLSCADLKTLCSDTQSRSMDAVASTLIHAEDAIREAGFLLVGAIVDDDGGSRSEIIGKVVSELPVPFLTSFADAIDHLTGGEGRLGSASPFEPMRHIYRCSKDVLDGLCDSSAGLLRSRTLTAEERKAVKRWWTMEWQFVDHSFLRARAWSEDVEKSGMENYCRDVMEFARLLMAQDGLIASALAENGGSTSMEPFAHSSTIAAPPSSSSSTKNDSAMREVLDAPQKHSMGLFEMIQLRDQYLVGIIVDILVKLFTRLKEFNLSFPDRFVNAIRSTYTAHPQIRNKFKVNTNMNDTQRAELMKAIGDGGDDDDDEDVEIVSWSSATVAGKSAKKRQTTIEAWSRGGSGTVKTASSSPSPAPSVSSKEAASQLTPGLNKHKALLDRMKATAAAKPDQKALLANRAAIREARQRDKAEIEKHKAEAIARARALRAAPVKSDIMSRKGEQLLDEVERRKRAAMKQMMARMPVKKIKQQRSAKDMRARIIPNMDRLHQAILEWDIFHEGNDPPSDGFQCVAVADDYMSPAEYKKTFFPLLINEAWRSFVTAKEESTAKAFGVKVVTRISVDNFLEVSTLMPAAANRERLLGEGDIVLLSRGADPLTSRGEPHCLARVWKLAMKRENCEVTYRLNSRRNLILPVLLPGAEFRAVKITNMTTIEREYAALESLQYYDLMDEVLKAAPSPMLTFGDGAVAEVQRTYELNRGQAVAILHGKANDGFTLVQGPPGTGKTKTIVAMVGALLTGTIKTNAAAVAVSRPGANGHGDSTTKKLLVCAPSNAAVDELVLRLKMGVRETTGALRKINVVRLGRSEAINSGVKDVTLEELVKSEISRQTKVSSSSGGGGGGGSDAKEQPVSDRERMHLRAGEIKAKVMELMPALEAARRSDDRDVMNRLQREHDELRSEQRRIGAQIERDKESGNTYARETEIKRRQIQQKILNEAHVLCATLSGSGHDIFKNLNVEFETVVIDEAAQCVELSALIPLKYGCAKCILVGDPKQLPPTVLSQSAARYGYDQSLFVRMQRNRPQDVHLLDTQYRMHPDISRFPSRQFYEGRLIDGADMARLRAQPWHANPLLGPYRFFDVSGAQEKGHRGRSLVNENEVGVALQLYRRFRAVYGSGPQTSRGDDDEAGPKIGIITPYKAQLQALRSRFSSQFGDDILQAVEFNTTDAFQGRECDIIIFSHPPHLNVGLTRARSSLWILGDSRALRQGEFWHALIEDAKGRGEYTGGDVMGLLRNGGGGGRQVEKPKPAMEKPKQERQRPVQPVQTARKASGSSWSTPSRPVAAVKNNNDDDEDDSYSPPPAMSPPSQPPRKQRPPPPMLPTTYTVVDRPGRPAPAPSDIAGIGGINERGEPLPTGPRNTERPVVQSGPAVSLSNKKRPHEEAAETQPSKRTAPEAMLPARPPPRRPTDPSAMQVLGIDEPSQARPPPQAPRGPRPPMRPKKKGPADPFIKKKPKRM
ncbi:tRNA-splicing [Grosmannia clavigera kw1407]|uniref:tRNA-splicing n=1 Tax=Grosmannia clavigera (strain kw1407 / UAMH 11150) TaxID=655863 RepID=F0XK57_GROCL|nr:tRNA-splicing [Grosmannia clavigera kw1407]EFX01966.1 tRNA-splicing [Grosmannia clavigera kw1407]